MATSKRSGSLLLGTAALFFSCISSSLASPAPTEWREKISGIIWIAYAPSRSNPSRGIEAKPDAIAADLAVLRQAGFTGLVTYGSSGTMGTDLPKIAEATGFRGLIIGIWNPKSERENATAKLAAAIPIVLGYCVGNEGLDQRYKFTELAAAISSLREATGKAVTTAEQIEDYDDDKLLQLGDWIFPTVHPYFHRQLAPTAAVQWTENAWMKLSRRTDRFVWFKEVGLPTAGAEKESLSESNQQSYYVSLSLTPVRFVYFEAFDQPWKTHLPVEPHWGLFRADRSPKSLASYLQSAAREQQPPSIPTQR